MKKQLFKITGIVFTLFAALIMLDSCKIIPVKERTYYSKGIDAARKGQFEEAESYLARLKSAKPGDKRIDRLTIVIAEEYLERSNFTKSRAFAEKIRESEAESFIAGRKFEILGDIYLSGDENLKAVEKYIRSLDFYEKRYQEKIKGKTIGVISEKLNEGELKGIAERYEGTVFAEEALYNLVKQKALSGDIAGSRKTFERYNDAFPGRKRADELREIIRERQKKGTVTAIGCILPLSGKLSDFGEYVRNGIITAQIIRSEMEGYQQTELIFKDSAGIPENASAAFEELANNVSVVAVIGPLRSACVKACSPLADKYDLPLISPTADADYIEGLSPYVFRNCLLPEAEAAAIAEFAVKDGLAEDIAILHGDDFYGQKLSELFTKKIEEIGSKVKIDITYPSATTDFSPYVKKLYSYLESGGVIDTIYLPCDFDKAGFIIPQLPYNDMGGFQIYGSNGWDSGKYDPRGNPQRLLEIVLEKAEIEGAVFTDSFSVWGDNAERQDFITRYRQLYDATPNVYGATGYDSYMLILKELKKRVRGRKDLRKKLSRIRDYEGVSGFFSMYGNGKIEKQPFFIKVFGGQFMEFKPENEEND